MQKARPLSWAMWNALEDSFATDRISFWPDLKDMEHSQKLQIARLKVLGRKFQFEPRART
jgi:hypothetical protein